MKYSLLFICMAEMAVSCSGGLEVANPRVEYMKEPLGIDIAKPRFSWEISSSQREMKQTAYQVLVATDVASLKKEQGDAWDSGKTDGNETNQIYYDGKPFVPNT
ncbi:MAG: alpha-rhamnosidase, partial [Tannerella sp.]|nr:alpha-rhamnosidase [Tannerella sp.]